MNQPHDKYIRSVLSNAADAASLLSACVPPALARTLQWSSLELLPGRFVSPDWRDSEADLLFSVQQEAAATRALIYVLLEHQSSPDRWMPLRMLNYCTQVWMQWRSRQGDEPGLPLIVPLVLYQGAGPWRYEREFADLFTNAASEWRWVPRFEHLLIDQTRQSAQTVAGGVAARLVQIAMMAAFRDMLERDELLEEATRLMGELYGATGFEGVTKHVEYVLATQPPELRRVFAEALRRNVPGRGGDVMNYVEQMIERGRRAGLQAGLQEGRQEGHLEGQVTTIEGFLKREVPWSTVEAATGVDEETFRKLRQRLAATRTGHDGEE